MVAGVVALACLAALVTAGTAKSMAIRIQPVSERISTADCVVLGKVTAIEKKSVGARSFPGAIDKAEYKIAVVHIEKAFVGAKGLTEIRVGFIAPAQPQIQPRGGKVGGGIRPHIRPIGRPFFQPSLTKGQEGLFLLNKHFEEPFYIMGFGGAVNKQNNPNFKNDLEMVKRCVKLLEKPTAGLKAKDPSERLLTASLLISRYRTAKPTLNGKFETKPIDAEESKLILTTLAEADWTKFDMKTQVNAQGLFFRLGVTDKDGWKPPMNFQQFPAAAKEWLKKNASTYRVQRFVEAKEGKRK
jgi:hypothetical protein